MSTQSKAKPLFYGPIVRRAVLDAFRKLNPRHVVRNPVMFVVEVGSLLTSHLAVLAFSGRLPENPWFILGVSIWLWVHGVIRQFRRGDGGRSRQGAGDTLRKARRDILAKKLRNPRDHLDFENVAASSLRAGDVVLVHASQLIPGDGRDHRGSRLGGRRVP
jgi:K+-transporting ATPase ATPase B chain